MTEYLVFRLYGPMCSWGEIAVGESRHSADHPSRSALLGLFAAALGIPRSEEEAQSTLAASWRFGVKLLSPGTLLRDYHTVQAPKRQKNVHHRTRRSELLATDISTLLSTREYRVDSVSVIAAEPVPAGDPASASLQIQQMQRALSHPVFCLYLGRKSCPLAMPLVPRLVPAASLQEALDEPMPALADLSRAHKKSSQPSSESGQPTPWPSATDRYRFRMDGARYFWEDGMSLNGTEDSHKLEFIRHDQPVSRRRWQFAPRREWTWLAPVDDRSRSNGLAPVPNLAEDLTA